MQAAWREPDATPDTSMRLADELKLMAKWLGLGDVRVVGKGDLAQALGASLATGNP